MTVAETFISQFPDPSLGRPKLERADEIIEAAKLKIRRAYTARLSRVALKAEVASQTVGAVLQQDEKTGGPGIDYSALNQATHTLAKTVERAHRLDPRTVPYEAWMTLLRASDTLYVSPRELPEPVLRSPSHRMPTWQLALDVARNTVSGTPAEDDPAIRQVINQPTPTPYDKVVAAYTNSDPNFPTNLDPYYRQSTANINTAALTPRQDGLAEDSETAAYNPFPDMVQGKTEPFSLDDDLRHVA